MRPAFALCAALLLTGCPLDEEAKQAEDARNAEALRQRQANGGNFVPFPDSPELIARIEERVEMPAGASRLNEYTRRYSRSNPDGSADRSGYVYGVLERITDAPRNAQWVEGILGAPADGGCAVVTLRYSVAAGRVDRIACNGES